MIGAFGGLLAGMTDLDHAAMAQLSMEQMRELFELAQAAEKHEGRTLHAHLFPEKDTPWAGPPVIGGLIQRGQILHARHKYPKHMEFFEKGAKFRERCFLAANRVGKTLSGGGYEMACHLTGQYPAWWKGRRFDGPISAWVAGDTYKTTRDVLQLTLFGRTTGTGMGKRFDGQGIVPGWAVGKPTWQSGVSEVADTVIVRHVTGGNSQLGMMSYDQGRTAFQGTGRHVIWLDEEPPALIYDECLMRTATTNGIIMLTFTPLQGYSQVVMGFMPSERQILPAEPLDVTGWAA